MKAYEIHGYLYYEGNAIRLSDNHIFKNVVVTFDRESLKNISDIAENGCRNGNQDIMIESMCIPKSDYSEFLNNQTLMAKNGPITVLQSTISRPNFKLHLESEREDGSKFVLIISSIQFRIDSSEELNLGGTVSFENVKAIILGGCVVREGGLQ